MKIGNEIAKANKRFEDIKPVYSGKEYELKLKGRSLKCSGKAKKQ